MLGNFLYNAVLQRLLNITMRTLVMNCLSLGAVMPNCCTLLKASAMNDPLFTVEHA